MRLGSAVAFVARLTSAAVTGVSCDPSLTVPHTGLYSNVTYGVLLLGVAHVHVEQ